VIEWCKELCKESETVPEAAEISECGSWSLPHASLACRVSLLVLSAASQWAPPVGTSQPWNPTRPPPVDPPVALRAWRSTPLDVSSTRGAVSICIAWTRGCSLSLKCHPGCVLGRVVRKLLFVGGRRLGSVAMWGVFLVLPPVSRRLGFAPRRVMV